MLRQSSVPNDLAGAIVCLKSFGVSVEVRTPGNSISRRLIKLIVKHLSGAVEICAEVCRTDYRFEILLYNGGYRLQSERHEVFESVELDAVLEVLLTRIRLTVAEFAVGRVFVHAGVVGWKGRAIVAPAQTYQGKTTLIKELIGLGAIYYSDDCAVLDEDGRVHPFPKTVSVRGEIGKLKQVEYPVERFGGVRGREPIPVGMILFTHYDEKAGWEPVRLTSGQGVFEMLSHTIPIRYNPEFSLKVLNNAANHAIIVKMQRGEAKYFAVELLKYIEDEAFNG